VVLFIICLPGKKKGGNALVQLMESGGQKTSGISDEQRWK